MKLINQNVEEWHCGYTLPEIWSHIAKCARVCYQSEPRNNGETDEEFVKRVILRNHSFDEIAKSRELQLKLHLSVLEHGTVYLNIPREEDTITTCAYLSYNHYSERTYGYGLKSYVTTNMRVLVEQGLTEYLRYICAPTRRHYLRTTFNITTDIGVARELARHRTHSISEESTRYCNYGKSKFGNELTFIIPEWVETRCPNTEHSGPSSADMYWSSACKEAESNYLRLLENGWTPQQARQILPLSTKVQTIHTAFESDWAEFISLRADACSGSVHPNMNIIANKIKVLMSKEANNYNY